MTSSSPAVACRASTAPACSQRAGCASYTHVFTVARVAEMLGVDEDLLHEIAIEMKL